MKDKLTKIIHDHTVSVVSLDPSKGITYGMLTVNTVKAIEKMYSEMNCGNCKAYSSGKDWKKNGCQKHDVIIQETKVLKCNDWEAK